MSALTFASRERCAHFGLKGPRAAEWLVGQAVVLPMAANSWTYSSLAGEAEDLLVARLGTAEFFLEDEADGATIGRLKSALRAGPGGVYPVLREDSAFQLSGAGVHEVLAQVCHMNFAELVLASHPLIMTLMIGVAVLVMPRDAGDERSYRIWCDPTFGPSLGETLGRVVVDCGGSLRGVSA